jgi:hypothetical protein
MDREEYFKTLIGFKGNKIEILAKYARYQLKDLCFKL